MQFWCGIHQTNRHDPSWHRFAYRRFWLCQQILLGKRAGDTERARHVVSRHLAPLTLALARES